MGALSDEVWIANILEIRVQHFACCCMQAVLQYPRDIVSMGDSKNECAFGIKNWWHQRFVNDFCFLHPTVAAPSTSGTDHFT